MARLAYQQFERFTLVSNSGPGEAGLLLRCGDCDRDVCVIDDEDTLFTICQVAAMHDCSVGDLNDALESPSYD